MGWIHKLLCLCEHDWQQKKIIRFVDQFDDLLYLLYVKQCSKCLKVYRQKVKR